MYGAGRIPANLYADGQRVSRMTVAASLRRLQLSGISLRMFRPATKAVDLDARHLRTCCGAALTSGAGSGVDRLARHRAGLAVSVRGR